MNIERVGEEKSERIRALRKELVRTERLEDEHGVLRLEAQIRAEEKGEQFDEASLEESIKNQVVENSLVFPEKTFEENIFTFSSKTAEYIHTNGVANIIFLDRSARLGWIGIHEYWKQTFPQDEQPGFYFMNPSGFDTQTKPKFLNILPAASFEKEEEIMESVQDTYKKLMHDKDKPIIIFDTCSHRGKSINDIHSILTKIGFNDIRVITAAKPDEGSGVKSEISFEEETGYALCYPFGRDESVHKGDLVHSERNNLRRRFGKRTRKEIRAIIRSFTKE